QVVEGGEAAQRPEERDDEYTRPEPEEAATDPALAAKGGQHQEERRGAQVLAVQVDPVPSPVVLQYPAELRQVGVDQLLWREGIGDGVLPPCPTRAWRPV